MKVSLSDGQGQGRSTCAPLASTEGPHRCGPVLPALSSVDNEHEKKALYNEKIRLCKTQHHSEKFYTRAAGFFHVIF